MPKKSGEINQNKNPVLIKSRSEVSDTLQNRIKLGEDLLKKEIRSESDLDQFCTEKERWDKYNLEYLKHCFDISAIADNYNYSGATSLYMNPSFNQQIESARQSLQLLINELKSIDERLPLFEERFQSNSQIKQLSFDTNKVFIV